MSSKKNRSKDKKDTQPKPPSPPQPEREEPTTQQTVGRQAEEGPAKQQKDVASYTRPFSMRDPDWVMVVLIGLYWLFTYLLWRAARNTIEDARSAFVVSNRAYMCIKDSNVFNASRIGEDTARIVSERQPLKAGEFAFIQITLANSGNTPALKVAPIAFIQVRDTGLPDDPVYEEGTRVDVLQSVATVPKDGSLMLKGPNRTEFSQQEITAIEGGTKFLVMYGYVTYDDVFGEHRKTKFCYAYTPRLFDMSPCPTHNQID